MRPRVGAAPCKCASLSGFVTAGNVCTSPSTMSSDTTSDPGLPPSRGIGARLTVDLRERRRPRDGRMNDDAVLVFGRLERSDHLATGLNGRIAFAALGDATWQSRGRFELEDTTAFGSSHRIVEINAIGDANEHDTERDPSRVRTEHIAEELDALLGIQLTRDNFLCLMAPSDRCAADGAQIADPVDLTPGGPHPPLASYLDNRQRGGARQPTLPAANGDQPVGT